MNNQVLFRMLEGQNIDNKYYLNQLLGSGGFGGVYLADEVVRDRLIRTVALKLIITDNPDKQLDELIFSTTLEHPNLINCYTCGECNLNNYDFLYLLMEKADYSLEDELKKGKLSEENVKQLALDIANGLDYLHSQNPVIVHRDLKPGNILRVGDKWKISDFGLVRSLKNTATQTSTISGTIAYAPPEAYDGNISPAWDIWSLGVLIYESLTGKLPFEGDNLFQLMQQVINSTPDYDFISNYWQNIIKGCLIKDNKGRFSSQDLGNKLRGKTNLKNNNISNNIKKIKEEKNIDLLIKQADSLRGFKQYQEAIDFYNQAIELNPNDADIYNYRGVAYSELKEYEKAIADCNQAIELDPNLAIAYNNRGLVYSNLGEYEKAIESYNQAIELDPNNAIAYNNRGFAYSELKEYQKAIADCNQAIELDPNLAIAYNNCGLAYNTLGEYEKALEDFNQAIKLDPNNAIAYNNLGVAYKELKEYQKAISEYNKAIELDPNYSEVYSNRGLAYGQLKEYEKAIADYNKAIELDPNNAITYYNRGVRYYYLKEYQRAIADYTKAIELDPNCASAYIGRSNCYYILQEYIKYVADCNQALKLNPNLANPFLQA